MKKPAQSEAMKAAWADPEKRENMLASREGAAVGAPRKDVCIRGHAMVEENLVIDKGTGARHCKACRDLRRHEREAARQTGDEVAAPSATTAEPPTVCPAGHPLSGDNLTPDGKCRECRNAYTRAWRASQPGDHRPTGERNAAKTHCIHGHEFTPENTYARTDGGRGCKQCRLESGRTGRPTHAEINAAKTHCPKGHPYEGENLVVDANGKRTCRACRNERARAKSDLEAGRPHVESYEKKPHISEIRRAQTHCKYGHLLDGNNLRLDSKGKRYCKTCDHRRLTEWRKANPEEVSKRNRRRLLKSHSMTQEEFEALLRKQEGKCASCHNPFKSRKDTHIDHDHQTGKNRGLLCGRCNPGIGHFDDSPDKMCDAIIYLAQYKPDPKGTLEAAIAKLQGRLAEIQTSGSPA